MLIFISAVMVILLVWMVLCEMKRDRDTKAKLDGLERIVERIEEKMKKE